jgi:hypothetical protein
MYLRRLRTPSSSLFALRHHAVAKQPRQLHNVRRDPPRGVLREQLGRRSPAGLVLEINIAKLLPVGVVLHHEGGTDGAVTEVMERLLHMIGPGDASTFAFLW